MAKKSRRVQRKKPRLSETQLARPTKREVPVEAETPEPQPAPRDFTDEYRYVIKDLQRIGILAAVILGALVGLSFLV